MEKFSLASSAADIYLRAKASMFLKTNLSGGGLTEKDEKDAAFGREQNVDYIGLSFVQTADDVKKLRNIIGSEMKIIAKIGAWHRLAGR